MDANHKPAPQIRFIKKIDGTYYVVESAFENNRKKLWVQSAYLQKNEDVTQTPAEGMSTNHETNAQSASVSPSSNSSISENGQIVNETDGTQNRAKIGWDGRVAVTEATGPNVTVDGVTYKLLGYDENGSKVYQDVEVLKELNAQENNIENSDKSVILGVSEALEFNDGEATNDFFYYDNKNDSTMKTNETQYNKWKEELTEESVRVIRDFTGVGANEINQYLRKKPGWETLNVGEITKQIKEIDDTIASFVLTESIVVQRGASESSLDILFDGSVKELSDLVGKPYRDDGFMSTTALVGNPVATTKPVLFTITIPAGKGRGAYINEFSAEFQDAEYEFLIKRGATFTITEVSEDQGSGKIYVKMVMDVE